MADRHEAARHALEEAVFSGKARLDSRTRRAIGSRQDVPAELRELVEKIAHHAYRVTDEDVAKLRSKYTEDELFEVIVSASLGAAAARLDAGLRLLEEK